MLTGLIYLPENEIKNERKVGNKQKIKEKIISPTILFIIF